MDSIEINQGAFESFIIEDTQSFSVSMLVSEDKDTPAVISTTPVEFVDGVAQINLTGADTDIPTGDYIYEFRFYDEEGNYENISRDDCDGEECGFGTLSICPSILEGSS
jgi:hypothetical protein